MKKVLALFDLDGTITRRDTLFDFILRTTGPLRFVAGFGYLVPDFIRYVTGTIHNSALKERVLIRFFSGWSLPDFERAGRRYSRIHLPRLVRPRALERIRWHRGCGHRVVVVSASIRNWLEDWCRENDLELIATEMEISGDRLTGRFNGINCYGPEKVRRIRQVIRLDEYDRIYGYGDSGGDLPMLDLASDAFFKPFRGNRYHSKPVSS